MPKLIPFVLTTQHNQGFLDLELGLDVDLRLLDDPTNAPFARLLNWTNQLAFGGDTNMGMPLWVMLDCGILSSAIVGFGVPLEEVDDALREKLSVPDDYEDPLVPVSEYCACPTSEPGGVSGFSLQSQLPGYRLGLRTKALALAVYKATTQVGVTQFDNPSIRGHARLGLLRVLMHRPSVHTHAHNSFVYQLDVPQKSTLLAIAKGELDAVACERPAGTSFDFDPSQESHHAQMRAKISAGHGVWITQPGWRAVEDGCRLDVICEG